MSRCLSIDDDGPGGARGGISAVEPTMHQDLLNDDTLMDKADDPHLSLTMRTGQWINLPYFLNALPPYR